MAPDDDNVDDLLDSLLESVSDGEKKTAKKSTKPVIVRPPKPVVKRPQKVIQPMASPSIQPKPILKPVRGPEKPVLKNLERLKQQSAMKRTGVSPGPAPTPIKREPLTKPKPIQGPSPILPKKIPKSSPSVTLEPIKITGISKKSSPTPSPAVPAPVKPISPSSKYAKEPETVRIKIGPSLKDLIAKKEGKTVSTKPADSSIFDDEYKSVQKIKEEILQKPKPITKRPADKLETFKELMQEVESTESITPGMNQDVDLFVETAQRVEEVPIFAEEIASEAVTELVYDKNGYLIPKTAPRPIGVKCPNCGKRFEPLEPERCECPFCMYVWYI
ncbi:MAG: hypothetical protein ACTSRW_03295 [Candidatus Helarchaeota archaeon]